jgi:hypothetical protein
VTNKRFKIGLRVQPVFNQARETFKAPKTIELVRMAELGSLE